MVKIINKYMYTIVSLLRDHQFDSKLFIQAIEMLYCHENIQTPPLSLHKECWRCEGMW